jgi:hypothetical protein
MQAASSTSAHGFVPVVPVKYFATMDSASNFLRTSAPMPGAMWHSTHAILLCFEWLHES